jgi:hypothetical protein
MPKILPRPGQASGRALQSPMQNLGLSKNGNFIHKSGYTDIQPNGHEYGGLIMPTDFMGRISDNSWDVHG